MDNDRKDILLNYIGHLYTMNLTYHKVGKYIKYVSDFLENAESINRRGYLKYRREHADVLASNFSVSDAICDLLDYLNIGYNRKEKTVRALKRLETISSKNSSLVNDFIIWLKDNNDYSQHTIRLYYTSMSQFFKYANEVNMENCRRYIRSLEEEKRSPATISLRMTAIERFSKWMKKPIELRRPKIVRKLDVNNVPTEEEYKRLIEYLKTNKKKDYYFFIKILGTTGARLSEFFKFTWEDIIKGEVTLRGKGNKYRRFFFQKNLRQEVISYVKETGKTGLIATGKYGPLTREGFSSHLKDWGKHCGIDKRKMHAHAFRHFFAKMFLKKNNDVIQLAELMGHGSVNTTRIYLQKSYEEQKKEFNRSVTW